MVFFSTPITLVINFQYPAGKISYWKEIYQFFQNKEGTTNLRMRTLLIFPPLISFNIYAHAILTLFSLSCNNYMSKIIIKTIFIIWIVRLESQSFQLFPGEFCLIAELLDGFDFRTLNWPPYCSWNVYKSKTKRTQPVPQEIQTLKTNPNQSKHMPAKEGWQLSNKRYLQISYFLFHFPVDGNEALLQGISPLLTNCFGHSNSCSWLKVDYWPLPQKSVALVSFPHSDTNYIYTNYISCFSILICKLNVMLPAMLLSKHCRKRYFQIIFKI